MTNVAHLIFLLGSAATDLQRMDSATDAEKSENLKRVGESSAASGRIHTQALN